ncbi:MAG: hypothetical protein JWM11_4026 [Planctomycetaceae bacterium]|nr:hypothetical protein [Planctomycetaceae bacterium]
MSSLAESQGWITFRPSECPLPNWVNAPNLPGFMSYSGGDCRVSQTENRIEWLVDVRWPKWFIPRFAAVFIPAMTLLAWFFGPFPINIAFACLAPISGGSAFALIYWLLLRHEQAGNYLVLDRHEQTVTLPRQKRTFGFLEITNFQWINGRGKHGSDSNVDFHLLARDASGVVYRYHIMGSPVRTKVKDLADFCGIPVHEYQLGSGRSRDADVTGS